MLTKQDMVTRPTRLKTGQARLPIVERAYIVEQLKPFVITALEQHSLLGLVVIELCRADEISQEYGYDNGFALFRALADRIIANTRDADILMRIGTAELLLVMPGLKSTGQPILAAQRIVNCCNDRFELNGRHLKATLRLGISIFPDDADKADNLLRRADAALLQGRRCEQSITTCAESRVGFETAMLETQYDLESAIDNGELLCHFQPKIELASGRLTSFESLTRWQAADGKMIPPHEFIAVAEQSELITPLTFRSLNESVRECVELQATFPGLSVAVNLSPMVLHEPNLKDIVLEALEMWGLSPELLIFEITESAVMRDIETSIIVLKSFRDSGIGISIDDFGTGHSSLAYLRRLPATELKIDKSFVGAMMNDANEMRLVQAVIDLACSFGLRSVAEGIEDGVTLDTLRDLGCTLGQGYYIAKAMAPEAIPDWFQQSPWHAPNAAPSRIRARAS